MLLVIYLKGGKNDSRNNSFYFNNEPAVISKASKNEFAKSP